VWSDFSREKLKQWMKDGHLLVNGNIVKPKYRYEGNELLNLNVEREHRLLISLKIFHWILFMKMMILVINKPVGMVVHPAQAIVQGHWLTPCYITIQNRLN
jgi:23S rRNA pseudouridine1911/1915/1917 synthase